VALVIGELLPEETYRLCAIVETGEPARPLCNSTYGRYLLSIADEQ